ncbi:MAG: hypothetical protein CMP67_05560 [Flavobacteriales bacterium]|nr:hypothetical protein [Flavobacteriales bacterium]
MQTTLKPRVKIVIKTLVGNPPLYLSSSKSIGIRIETKTKMMDNHFFKNLVWLDDISVFIFNCS